MRNLLVVTLFLVARVQAADESADGIPPQLRTCASIKINSERLACYDSIMGALVSGKPGAEAVAPTAESSFGLLTSERAPQAAADARAELQSVTANVRSFGRAQDGSRVFHLDNGQSWVQLSGGDTLLKVGDPVTINRAALGSFQMRVPSGRSVKVKRVGN